MPEETDHHEPGNRTYRRWRVELDDSQQGAVRRQETMTLIHYAPRPNPKYTYRNRIRTALARACDGLRQYRQADGGFDGAALQGVSPLAHCVIVEFFLGMLTPADARAAVCYLRSQLQPNGGFRPYHNAGFCALADTCCADAALACCGVPADDPDRRKIRIYIDANGGLAATESITRTFLVMAGELDAACLPELSLLHLWIPGMTRYLGRHFLLPYGAIMGIVLPALTIALKNNRRDRRWRRERQWVIDWLRATQNPDGNWGGSLWFTVLALACLHALSLPHAHPLLQRGMASLARWKRRTDAGLLVLPFNADVWNSAVALRALTQAGAAQDDPQTGSTIKLLLDAQSDLYAPQAWQNPPAGAPRTGGWAFATGNPLVSDVTTTATVLATLAAHAEHYPRVAEALAQGADWLLGMQNPDGGFAAFTHGQPSKGPEPLFQESIAPPATLLGRLRFLLQPPLECVDYSAADVTGRVLHTLGALGYDRAHPKIAAAVAFLEGQRLGDVWWGRWTTNYLAATAVILVGLKAVGEDLLAPNRQRAVRWILSRQNENGGFGERNITYTNPGLAGFGPSNAHVTGLVIQALCAAGERDNPVTARAVSYLLANQCADGLWEETQAVQAVAPPDVFCSNFVNFQTAPMEALAVYLDDSD